MQGKTVKLLTALCAVIFVAALIGTAVMLQKSGADDIVVSVDGEVLYSGPGKAEEPLHVRAVYGEGSNLIRIDARGVCVEWADCAGQECVHMGYLKNKNLPIVCLPHRMVIRFAEAAKDDGLDAVSQ